jgi:hypothetical protein
MMNMKEKLDLLALSDGFTVKNCLDGTYEVHSNNSEMVAVISDGGYVEYYKAYCGNDFMEIVAVDDLLRLKDFVEALIK